MCEPCSYRRTDYRNTSFCDLDFCLLNFDSSVPFPFLSSIKSEDSNITPQIFNALTYRYILKLEC